MDVPGTQLLEKDIENLARGEAGCSGLGGRGTPRAEVFLGVFCGAVINSCD